MNQRKIGVVLSYLHIFSNIFINFAYIPILIFGASAVQTAALGEAYNMQLAVLGAGLAIALLLAPLAAAGALRVSVNA